MQTNPGDVVVAFMMVVFAVTGVVLTAGAQDDEMYVFGIGLVLFSAAFLFSMIKKHYDAVDHALVPVKPAGGDHG